MIFLFKITFYYCQLNKTNKKKFNQTFCNKNKQQNFAFNKKTQQKKNKIKSNKKRLIYYYYCYDC
jgi:hypothetical protein